VKGLLQILKLVFQASASRCAGHARPGYRLSAVHAAPNRHFIRVVFVVYATISSPQVVLSRSPFKSSERYIALTVFLLCSLHFCVENAARIRIQYIVPLPDILHTLRKQFLAEYYNGDTFTGFHYLFSSSDILWNLTTGFHVASHSKL